jgi:hypothetical protein
MSNRETAEVMARTRIVSAEAVLNHTADLRGYPHRHLAILSHRGVGPERVTYALMAADALDRFGWELLNVAEFGSSKLVHAFLRRR